MNELLFTPLSLSQLLKQKGVKQESMFYWEVDNFNVTASPVTLIYRDFLTDEENIEHYSAFTISELPDVFRQMFGEEKYTNAHFVEWLNYTYYVEWIKFTEQYFKDPKSAWETLEKTIRSL